MLDIWIAILVMFLLSAGAAMLSLCYLHTDRGQRVMLLLALSIMATVYYQLYLAGQLFWARIVPHPAAIIYTNLAPICAGLGAGWGWRLPNIPRWRRILVAASLGLASLVTLCWPLLSMAVRPPPAGQDVWKGSVALQTSWATCSPAAAATFLNANGILAGEPQLIPLCLTDSAGTPTLGLYRGVKLMADRHNREVEIVDRSFRQLLEDNQWPVLMAVRLPFGVEDPRFVNEWGWIPGMGHSVVALGPTADGGILIGDPAVGLERWSESNLETLWQGNGMRLR